MDLSSRNHSSAPLGVRPGSTHLFMEEDNLKTRTWECPGRILVVDDDPAFRLLATRYLHDQNHIVFQAENGEQALEIAKKEQPDAVLLDVNLPDIPGNEICTRLKADPELEHIIVVLVTASSDPEAHALVLSSGANDFLTKPVSKFTLDARIRFSLKYRRAVARMRRTHAELERRVAERTAALTRANAELKDEIVARNKAEAESQALEDQLRQAQKMEAIGRLAGGVAHDFNNLLMVIIGYADMLNAKLSQTGLGSRECEMIRKSADRARALTTQLLAFSRRQVLQPKILEPNRVVSDIERMLRRLIGEDINLCVLTDPKAGNIKADPGQIEQVLLNLAVNSRDAMPNGGTLTIETGNISMTADDARRLVGLKPGEYVVLSIADTGSGMDDNTRSHLFEPFFTTKGQGKGTGLGLSTVYGIVKQSQGYIWCESEVGKGTCFHIYLPRVDEVASSSNSELRSVASPQGRETVLLAEDEEGVRGLVHTLLVELGYTVHEASNGAEALELYGKLNGKVDLLITDLIMPKLGGMDLIAQLKAKRPDLRVIYMSGYADQAVDNPALQSSGQIFLSKPFRADTLARAVREVLDRAPIA